MPLEVGQRFDVFETTTDIFEPDIPNGRQGIGQRNPLMPNVNHIEIDGFTHWFGQFKKVATLKITKVK